MACYVVLQASIDGNTLEQLPEDGNLAQLRVIAIYSPTVSVCVCVCLCVCVCPQP